MTLESEMIDLLSRRRDKLFCDECLRRLLHGSHLRCIADTADAVGMAAGFRRLKGICANCGGAAVGTKAG